MNANPYKKYNCITGLFSYKLKIYFWSYTLNDDKASIVGFNIFSMAVHVFRNLF